MADGHSLDSGLLAAVQSAHYERWRRLHSPTPLSLPADLRRMLPESPQLIPSLLDAAAKNADDHSGEMRSVRSTAATLARAKSNQVLWRVLRGRDAELDVEKAQKELAAKNGGLLRPLTARPFAEIPGDWHSKAATGCRCAGAFSRCKDNRAEGAWSCAEVVCHHASLSFNPDSFVSEASEYVVLVASRDEAQQLIEQGRPPNWAQPGGLFKETFVCNDNGDLDAKVRADDLPENFLLREKTAWQTNRDFAALSDIILSIDGYSEEYQPKKHPHDPGDGLWMSFDYRLRECKETQFFIARSNGGINVDEGNSRLLWLPEKEGASNGLLYLYASKKLRFTQTRAVGREEVMVLNMMAPAILSMLMQQLVFDRPLELVSRDGAPAAAPAASSPATTPAAAPTMPPPTSMLRPTLSGLSASLAKKRASERK